MTIRLEEIARHVNWYMEPHQLLSNVNLFLNQVMARGSLEDIVAVLNHYSPDDFRKAYRGAPAGLFTKRAWTYWGLMLLDDAGCPMPERFPGANRFDWRRAT